MGINSFIDYNLVEWLVFVTKIVTLIVTISILVRGRFKYAEKVEYAESKFSMFVGSYLFYIILNIINEILRDITRLSLVGVSVWGLTIGNLFLLKYCLFLFYRGDPSKDKKVWFIFITYLLISVSITPIYSFSIYKYHNYEIEGIELPLWVPIVASILLISYFLIYLTIIIEVLIFSGKFKNFSEEELNLKNRVILTKKIRTIFFAGLSFAIMIVLLYIDLFSSTRTIFALIGWIFLNLALIHSYLAYHIVGFTN